MLYLLRFFVIVSPVPRLMLATFAVITVAGSVKLLVDPRQAREALVPILVLQAFAASAGFAVPARRGYYDLLLTHGSSRLRIAIVQWLTSVAPGAAACLVMALAEQMSRTAPVIYTTGTAAALTLVSILSWTITVPLPRFSGAIGWLLVFVMVNSSPCSRPDWLTFSVDGPSFVITVARVLVFPIAIVGRDLSALPLAAWSALVIVALMMAAALLWVERADFPLEAAQ